jgi:hypothetical protein
MSRAEAFAVLVFVVSSRAASAQTTDPVFRSWRWTEEVTTPRALALGGAVVGLADDAAAAVFNPAGLPTIPRAGELQLGVRFRTSESSDGYRLDHLTKFASPATLVVRLGSRVGLSYHFVTHRAASEIFFAGSGEDGTLRTAINGPGLGLGVRVSPFVSIGGSLNLVRLYVDHGEFRRNGAPGSPALQVRLASMGETLTTGTLGALVKARELSGGVAVRFGREWQGLRFAFDPTTRTVVDEGSQFGVRSPSTLSLGLAWQPSTVTRAGSFVLTSQFDYVRLGAVKPTSVAGVPFPASDYRVPDGKELRLGAEVSLPFLATWAARGRPLRPNRVQLRAGYHLQAAGSFVYQGGDAGQQALFPETDSRHVASFGLSLGATTIWRVSGTAAYRFGGGPWLFVTGVSIRYPGLFP